MLKVLNNTFEMACIAQGFHWNYVGEDFQEKHAFFGEVYDDLFDAVDEIAEVIRSKGEKVPFGTSAFSKNSLNDVSEVESEGMVSALLNANDAVLVSLIKAEGLENAQWVKDFLNGRIAYHRKLGWMLNSMK